MTADYDIIIIGTGAGGGTLAHQLASYTIDGYLKHHPIPKYYQHGIQLLAGSKNIQNWLIFNML